MFKTLKNALGLPDLRSKILYTLFILLIFRLGSQVFVPFVDSNAINLFLNSAEASGSIFGYLDILSGSAFSQATLFALSVSPYITASIVIQLLTIAIPALERLAKEGPEGQKKLTQITRAVTVVLGLVTAIGYYMFLRNYDFLTADGRGWFPAIVIIACYSAGASIIMWLAEKINENGIGNGISLVLLVNILSRGPAIVGALINSFTSVSNAVFAIVAVVVSLGMIVFIVFMTNSERKIPIQYAKRVVGRKMYGGQNSTLPIKLNMTGVLPIIFAQSIVSLPSTITLFLRPENGFRVFVEKYLGTGSWIYAILYFILIVAFSYFYIAISFNPVEVANNLQSNGGVIPGIRQGRPTAEYITKILNRITLIGAMFLSVIAVLPLIINIISTSVNSTSNMAELAFGGSSIIIVVGVILETVREIEAQMTMRHYKGFLE